MDLLDLSRRLGVRADPSARLGQPLRARPLLHGRKVIRAQTLPSLVGDLVNLDNQVGYLRAFGNASGPTRIPFHLLLVQLCGRRARTGSSTCAHLTAVRLCPSGPFQLSR